MKLFVISCLAALAAAAPQQFVDQFGNQQFVSDNQQFVSDGNQFVSDGQFGSNNQQFVSDGQFVSDNRQQFVSGGQSFGSDNGVRTVNSRFEQDQTGNFQYAYELSDGTKAEQVGRSTPGSQPETGSLEQQGSFEFVGDDGNTYRVDYTANEGGFQPQAPHLPVAPAQIPEYAQLRQEHPELFWAENGGAVIQQQPQQFDNQQFSSQQFDNQQFSSQQFDNQQFSNQFDNQQAGMLMMAAVAAAAPQFELGDQQQLISSQPSIRIISQKYEQDPVGNYEYFYEQDDGQRVLEAGRVQPGPQPETGSLEQQGYYEYIGDDGNTYRVDYLANEGGFQPRAPHLPQAPAQIPEYAQLRQEHPELFWAENQGVIINDQQFVQQQQFSQPQQDFSQSQLFDQPQQLVQQDLVQPQQFVQQDVNQAQQFTQEFSQSPENANVPQQSIIPQSSGKQQFGGSGADVPVILL
ncbi:Larval cuticle protein 65Ag2 [Amphibalanus amphitrite]|uniref:Larval cuticle protein 65Ag2 n=1 Tax=Amphibalanus amphitrite TaxID=1232801 RepID=A0A6A4XA55_AMPAM|nr:Larval cuticle protein 65Ag2 [Amphibalanus amphitrite]